MDRSPMKLMWVFPSFSVGASTRRFAALAGALGADYEHTVCALDGDFSAEAIVGPSVEWRKMEPPKKQKRLFSLGTMWSLRKALSAAHPDVLVTVGWGGVEWLMVNRGPGAYPHLHVEDALAPGETPTTLDGKRSYARRRAFTGRHRAYVATSRVLEQVLTNDWSAPPADVHYIPTGVDLRRYEAPTRDAKGRVIRMAAIGPLTEERRVDRSIRMIAELRRRGRNVGLVVLGDGPEQRKLEAAAEKAGVRHNVDFIDGGRDIAPYLAQFDIYNFTGDGRETPVSMIEAMASGLPVVATDVNDVVETVDPANRMFVRDAGDESALTAAAELLVADAELRTRIGAANKARATELYALDAMVRRYDQLFQELGRQSRPLMLPAPGRAVVQTA